MTAISEEARAFLLANDVENNVGKITFDGINNNFLESRDLVEIVEFLIKRESTKKSGSYRKK